MKKERVVLLVGLLLCGTVWAEGGSKFDGTWELNYTLTGEAVKGRHERVVELQLKGGSGTWHTQNASQKWSPCEYKDSPVSVSNATETDAQLRVERSKAVGGCEDFSVKLHLVDDKSLEGSFPRGTKITGQKK